MDKIKKTGKKWEYEDWFGALFLLSAVGMLGISVRLCFADGIWYDELYTMGLTDRSFAQLTAYTARDVHPPFYYYYVKVIQKLCQAVSPQINVILVGKLCSVLPLIGLLAYGITKVRRRFGLLCAGLFGFCVVAMPNLPQYTVEIRMYTLAMFLVTAAFLHGYEIVCSEGKLEQQNRMDWIGLVIYGILAAYTHYFAGAAIAVIYLFLLIYFVYENAKGAKYSWKAWLAAVAVSVFAFLPWMAAAARQVMQVKESYWILPLTWRIFGSCVKFLMKPPFGSGDFQVAAAVVLFALYVGLFFYFLWKNRKNRKMLFLCMAGTGVLIGVVLFGCAASFIIRPIFIVRYMLPAAGCFWLSFAVLVSGAVREKKLFLSVLCLILMIGIGDFRWFRNDETWRRVRMDEVKEALALIEPEDMVITQFNHVQGVAGYYLENEIYLWNSQPEELLCDIIENKYETITCADELKQLIKKGTNVWFIGDKQSNVLAEWERSGIHAKERQEFMLEVYWATLYEVSD